jgi:hypothetical protein
MCLPGDRDSSRDGGVPLAPGGITGRIASSRLCRRARGLIRSSGHRLVVGLGDNDRVFRLRLLSAGPGDALRDVHIPSAPRFRHLLTARSAGMSKAIPPAGFSDRVPRQSSHRWGGSASGRSLRTRQGAVVHATTGQNERGPRSEDRGPVLCRPWIRSTSYQR